MKYPRLAAAFALCATLASTSPVGALTELKTPVNIKTAFAPNIIPFSLKFQGIEETPVVRIAVGLDGKVQGSRVSLENLASFLVIDDNGDKLNAISLDCGRMKTLSERFLNAYVLIKKEAPDVNVTSIGETLNALAQGRKNSNCKDYHIA